MFESPALESNCQLTSRQPLPHPVPLPHRVPASHLVNRSTSLLLSRRPQPLILAALLGCVQSSDRKAHRTRLCSKRGLPLAGEGQTPFQTEPSERLLKIGGTANSIIVARRESVGVTIRIGSEKLTGSFSLEVLCIYDADKLELSVDHGHAYDLYRRAGDRRDARLRRVATQWFSTADHVARIAANRHGCICGRALESTGVG